MREGGSTGGGRGRGAGPPAWPRGRRAKIRRTRLMAVRISLRCARLYSLLLFESRAALLRAAVFMVSAGARAATTGRAASGGATRADAEASSRQTKVRRRNIWSWRAG